MKNRLYLVGAALSVLANAPVVLAEDTQVPDETKPGATRGIYLGSPVPTAAREVKIQVPVQPAPVKATPVVKKVQPSVVAKVKHPAVKHSQKTVIARQKTPAKPCEPQVASTKVESQPAPAVIPVSNTSVITAVLDRPGDNPKYKLGDKMVISVAANQDCNLVVFNYDSNNVLTQIFPNEYQSSGLVRAGETVQIGGPDSPFDYQVAGKGGQEKIFVYAYPTGSQAPLTIAMSPLTGTPFRSAEITPEQYRNMVNESKVFFSREVKISPKKGTQLTSTSTSNVSQPAGTPNKIELVFSVNK